MEDSGYDDTAECMKEACILRKQQMTKYNDELIDELETSKKRCEELDGQLAEKTEQLEAMESRYHEAEHAYQKVQQELRVGQAKFDAAGLTVARYQEDNVKMQMKVCYCLFLSSLLFARDNCRWRTCRSTSIS